MMWDLNEMLATSNFLIQGDDGPQLGSGDGGTSIEGQNGASRITLAGNAHSLIGASRVGHGK